ncbi:hypothetical protein [Paremcibacter congregatus]|uniref:hypothetical protein n=1 Tax=Paremcibacter congregatus TaxID=2043170 RepID=UPI003A8D6A05
MTKPNSTPMISDKLRELLVAAANPDNIEGPLARAMNVIRTAVDPNAKYQKFRHVIFAAGRYMSVVAAVDKANAVLLAADLGDHRIDYPGASWASKRIHGANDNAPFIVRVQADQPGGVA